MLEPGEVPKDEPIPGCTSRQPVALDTPQPSSFAAWANTQHAAGYQSITAKFTVPPAPAHHGRQILYIFPSLTGAVNPPILQPVLQWGFNTMFGGEYWVLAAWFVGNNIAAVTHPVVVNPGDVIDGSVVGTGACDAGVCAGWTVTGSDEANPSASVTLSVTESSTPSHYRSAQGGVLEDYVVNRCDDLPGGPLVFTDIVLTDDTGATLTPTWNLDTSKTHEPCHYKVENPAAGEIRIRFDTTPPDAGADGG